MADWAAFSWVFFPGSVPPTTLRWVSGRPCPLTCMRTFSTDLLCVIMCVLCRSTFELGRVIVHVDFRGDVVDSHRSSASYRKTWELSTCRLKHMTDLQTLFATLVAHHRVACTRHFVLHHHRARTCHFGLALHSATCYSTRMRTQPYSGCSPTSIKRKEAST